MYCSYCAGVLEVSQAVCPRCGRPVPGAQAAVEVPSAQVETRPSSVGLAALLLAIALGIGLLSTASIFITPGMLNRLPASFFARSIGFTVLEIVLLVCIWQRQAWARIGLALVLVWGIGNLSVTMLRISGSLAFASLFVPIVVLGLRVWAVFLLFKAESNAWYSKVAK